MIVKLKPLRNCKGAALATVLMVFVVLIILSISVMTLFGANLKQAKHQELRTQAYYLAMSGIDLGVSALMQEDADDNTLLDEFLWDSVAYPDIVLDLSMKPVLTHEINFGNDTVILTISALNSIGKREVKVHALATLHGSNVSNTLTFIFEAENPLSHRWE